MAPRLTDSHMVWTRGPIGPRFHFRHIRSVARVGAGPIPNTARPATRNVGPRTARHLGMGREFPPSPNRAESFAGLVASKFCIDLIAKWPHFNVLYVPRFQK
jgi:hypothetical protein